MNKYLLIGGFVAVVAGVAYVVTANKSPSVQAQNTLPIPTPEAFSKADAQLANAPENVAAVTRSATRSSASESQSSLVSITVEQTQNAVDFNAPGAGTAEQKAGAAAAANKAYQEAKQVQ